MTSTLVAGTASPLVAKACDDICKTAAVEAYLSALITHDASQIPLAPNVRRIENNLVTADTELGLRKDFSTSAKCRVILVCVASISMLPATTAL